MLFDENIIIYARSNWISVILHEYEFELQLKLLNWYVLSPSGAPASQQILNYINSRAELHEFDCFGFDLRAALAPTLTTAIIIKTQNIFHTNPFILSSTEAA